jgi:gas vesicle protein
MAVNSKHIATFILGAAAGLALAKYATMSEEEKEQFFSDIKDKANKVKDEAEEAFEQAKDYFEELKTKGAQAFKEYLTDAEKVMGDIFQKGKEAADKAAGGGI